MAVVGSGISGNTNPALNSNMSDEVSTYYEKVFLERAKYALIMKEGGQIRTTPANQGRTVNFTRRQPLAIITTPLGESSNPVTCVVNSCTVSMTLSEYGLTVNTSRILSLTSIDSGLKETIEQVGQNMGETLNRLTRIELENGTVYFGNNHNSGTFTNGDVLDSCNIRMIVQNLEIAKAIPYSDGTYMAKTDPISKLKLLGDTTWVNAHVYSDVKDLYMGEMGQLYQVRFLLNKDVSSGTEAGSTATSTLTRYYTYFHGDQSFGCYDLEKDQPKLYILPNVTDSNSPAGRVSIVSWAGSYATKLLNSNWVYAARFTAA